jgi:hypothetical protein
LRVWSIIVDLLLHFSASIARHRTVDLAGGLARTFGCGRTSAINNQPICSSL